MVKRSRHPRATRRPVAGKETGRSSSSGLATGPMDGTTALCFETETEPEPEPETEPETETETETEAPPTGRSWPPLERWAHLTGAGSGAARRSAVQTVPHKISNLREILRRPQRVAQVMPLGLVRLMLAERTCSPGPAASLPGLLKRRPPGAKPPNRKDNRAKMQRGSFCRQHIA